MATSVDEKNRLKREMKSVLLQLNYQKKSLAEKKQHMLLEEFEVRLSLIQPLYDKMISIHSALEESSDDEGNENELNASVTDFMEDYTGLMTTVKREIRTRTPPVTMRTVQNPSRVELTSQVKCPKISIPTYSGEPEKWMKFRDMFESLIHRNASISNIEKFHYLEMALKFPSDVGNVLDNFSASGDNYEHAWKAVCDRFNDSRKIIHAHYLNLINMKKMSSETAAEVRRILDGVSANLSALELLGYPMSEEDDFGNMIVLQMVITKLDETTLKEWKKFNVSDWATWNDIKNFLTAQWRSLEDISPSKKIASEPKPIQHQPRTMLSSNLVDDKKHSDSGKCVQCNESHFIAQCPNFNSMTTNERFNVAVSNKLCFNCLSSNHHSDKCTSKHRCRKCSLAHHTMLHFLKSRSTSNPNRVSLDPTTQPFQPIEMKKTTADGNVTLFSASPATPVELNTRNQKWLSTVEVDVEDRDGVKHVLRAVLDTGSDECYITSSAAQLLGLTLKEIDVETSGMFEVKSSLTHLANAKIHSRHDNFNLEVMLFVAPTITSNLPNQHVNGDDFDIPDGVILADPEFYVSKPVDMLLDNEVFAEIVLGRKIKLSVGPKLIQTRFGWIVMGKSRTQEVTHRTLLSCFSIIPRNIDTEDIDRKLTLLHEMEEFGSTTPVLTPEERYCEEVYQKTTTRCPDGKFQVRLPFKADVTKLGENLKNARMINYAIETRRKRDSTYDKLYVGYMEDYKKTGHMERIDPDDKSFAHYLPHHGVVKLSSSSTKLRPVCNASSKSETGLSLNDVLCVGPTVQPESFDILMRLREFKYVIIGDISKMYRQIWIHPDDRKFQTILWRTDLETEELKHYQLNTVTFGTASAPFLATRTINHLADVYKNEFPEASAAIKSSVYVDDFMMGVNCLIKGYRVRDQVRYLFASAGMKICKFASNSPKLLENLPSNMIESAPDDDSRNIIKALGIMCNLKTDELSYNLKPLQQGKITKASVLSELASLYDPVGWIGPVVLTAKLFMKKLWLLNLDWTHELPESLQEEWTAFRSTFAELSQIDISRHCYVENAVKIDIHGFSDASIEAYGAVVYVRSEDTHGNVKTAVICAKSRVAPKKQPSLARLELCGALLNVKLVSRIKSILSAPINDVVLWSDSTIVLNWITMTSSKLQTYVGNRVAAIQEFGDKFTWRHISGENNPADKISRGMLPVDMKSCDIWWNGPEFLKYPKSSWPQSIIAVNEHDPEFLKEVKLKTLLNVNRQNNSFFQYVETRFSSFPVLTRVIAYVLRLTNNSKPNAVRREGELSVDEREEAEIFIIKTIQSNIFASEYSILLNQNRIRQQIEAPGGVDDESLIIPQISKNSKLIALTPFIDEKGLIRVGGRLENSEKLEFDQKHPIILPKCHVTTIILRNIHEKNLHPGPTAMLNLVRERYWPLRGRQLVKNVIHRCITCFRAKPTDIYQLMAPLPRARANLTPPFSCTAVDYAGFYEIRSGTTRNAPRTKVYVAVFKCMCTGAVHIDLASDLSAKAFIETLDRFISRRGLCAEIYSDNATCFEGADNELRAIVDRISPDVQEYCADQKIKWKFTVPRAPHAGGIYESGIKSMKHHLRRAVKEDCYFTFEQFQTILCKIEAVINSRPLTPMTDDINDLEVLTPGHFLIGRPLVAKPQKNFLLFQPSQLNLWQRVQQVQQEFWNSWYHDYLSQLQTRPINFREQFDFRIGDLVLVKDSNLPPLKWLFGRIIKLFPGEHNVVRNVKVKTATGEKDRHVKYLCLLPIENPASEAEEDVSDGNINSD